MAGIMFQDITTLLLDPKAFKDTIDLFVERYKGKNISVVAGIEARGFIFGPPIALAIGAKFVPLRKPRKLPGEVLSEQYILEYGRDCLEMHVGAVEPGERALVVDDLIATGGTLCAAMNLLERVGAEVVECACVIELPELKVWNRPKNLGYEHVSNMNFLHIAGPWAFKWQAIICTRGVPMIFTDDTICLCFFVGTLLTIQGYSWEFPNWNLVAPPPPLPLATMSFSPFWCTLGSDTLRLPSSVEH
ncbi:Adenine phosphoribosyltransferase 1 [Morella rubra]|uniref:adenine phosphoribosyltransferase n=1 Tax=Morella rubra TaxID=262757 RepID=A0A6A1W2K6_9ROSI|nr:Adenine phosphoribosyltransferase 1 [Morella rubra]